MAEGAAKVHGCRHPVRTRSHRPMVPSPSRAQNQLWSGGCVASMPSGATRRAAQARDAGRSAAVNRRATEPSPPTGAGRRAKPPVLDQATLHPGRLPHACPHASTSISVQYRHRAPGLGTVTNMRAPSTLRTLQQYRYAALVAGLILVAAGIVCFLIASQQTSILAQSIWSNFGSTLVTVGLISVIYDAV